MKPFAITRLILDTVPQLYEAESGPYPVKFDIPGEDHRIFSVIPLTPALKSYLDKTVTVWRDLQFLMEGEIEQVIERDWIQQKFAVAWLESHTTIKTWNSIIDYFRRLSRRTTENQRLPKTVVIEPGPHAEASAKLDDEAFRKVFDWLGTSQLTYFRVDEDLGIKSFESIDLTELKDLEGYRFYPDILHPAIDRFRTPDSVVIHQTQNGSLLIADRNGVLVSKRAGESWTVYDVDHVIGSVAEVMKRQIQSENCAEDPSCVACSLFQVLFDMSMKRHGGLIVIDRPENLSNYVITGLERDESSPLNSIFTHSRFDGLEYSIPEVRKLVELSTVDGALILDLQGNLVQIGSMIVSHPSVLNAFGTRDAAAYSATQYGATALKVSADGKVSVFFKTPEFTADKVHRYDFL